MPWCPECKNEYIKGITECSECHVALVESLPEDNGEREKPPEKEPEELSGSLAGEDVKKLYSSDGQPYRYQKERYSDYASTAVLFLVFGICGYAFVALNLTGRLNVIGGTATSVIYLGIFSACTAIGIWTAVRAARLKGGIEGEQEAIAQITGWLTEHITDEYLAAHTNPDENEEINYLNISQSVLADAQKAFPESDQGLLEQLCEEHLN